MNCWMDLLRRVIENTGRMDGSVHDKRMLAFYTSMKEGQNLNE